ncbi:MAG: OmpA family protein [Pseudomonadota bacterium]
MRQLAARIGTVALMCLLVAGCADQKVKPGEVLCPLLGAVTGAGIAAGGFDSTDGGAIAAGAAIGAAAGYFMCREKEPEPKPAPKPRPKPMAKPKPPAPKDSDGDGVMDPNDQCPGTPSGVKVNAVGCPEVAEKLLSLEGVNFETNSATLMPESATILDQAVQALTDAASVHVRVEGHTDSRGSAAYNKTLSEKRAGAVVDYLVSKGISGDRLSAVGYGEAAPVAPNDTAENMYKNRRVDLVVTKN